MPRGDRTGPYGEGRMTGRKMGLCVGNDTPGYTSSPGNFARESGFGRGRGFGRGFGRGRGGFGFRRRFAWGDPDNAPDEKGLSWIQEEFRSLKEQISELKQRFSDPAK